MKKIENNKKIQEGMAVEMPMEFGEDVKVVCDVESTMKKSLEYLMEKSKSEPLEIQFNINRMLEDEEFEKTLKIEILNTMYSKLTEVKIEFSRQYRRFTPQNYNQEKELLTNCIKRVLSANKENEIADILSEVVILELEGAYYEEN